MQGGSKQAHWVVGCLGQSAEGILRPCFTLLLGKRPSFLFLFSKVKERRRCGWMKKHRKNLELCYFLWHWMGSIFGSWQGDSTANNNALLQVFLAFTCFLASLGCIVGVGLGGYLVSLPLSLSLLHLSFTSLSCLMDTEIEERGGGRRRSPGEGTMPTQLLREARREMTNEMIL